MKIGGHSIGPNAYLPLVDLSGFNLCGVDLSGSCLVGAKLIGVNLEGANLSAADLAGANISGANLRGAVLIDPALRLTDEECTAAWLDYLGSVGTNYPLELELAEWVDSRIHQGQKPNETEIKGKRTDLWKKAFIDEFPSHPCDFYGHSEFDEEWWDIAMWQNSNFNSYKDIDHDAGDDKYYETLFISIYRTNELASRAANFNSCIFDQTTIWPEASMTDDYPVWNQPDGIVWSRTGFAGDSRTWSNYWEGIEIESRETWEQKPLS